MEHEMTLADALRAAADLIEREPVLAEAFTAPELVSYTGDAEEFTTQVHALGGRRDKTHSDTLTEVSRRLGPLRLRVVALRATVCTPTQVGTKVVEVPDPNATVQVEVPVFEWECAPIGGLS